MYEERSICVYSEPVLPTAWMALLFTLFHSALDVSLSWCPSHHKEAYKKGCSCYECSVLGDEGKQVRKLGNTLTAFCPTVLGSLWKHNMQEKYMFSNSAIGDANTSEYSAAAWSAYVHCFKQ